jgi:hypothetical protein
VTVCRCRVCGARQVTRSRFELECVECGGDLVEEDSYDPEPEELRCMSCAYIVAAAGFDAPDDESDERDDEYAGGLTVEDACPRCGKKTLVPRSQVARRGQTANAVRVEPEFGLARRAAEGLLENQWTGETPVDVWKIAEKLGLRIEARHTRHEGRITEGVISVPAGESRTAQRFAIAHELGHRELRHQVNEDKIEAEAHAFASELLIPRNRLRRAVEAGLTLRALREHFDVSHQAITIALEDARLLSKVKG